MGVAVKNVEYTTENPWPEEAFLQGGTSGIVFNKDGSAYRTTFIEAFLDETFIRGEGETLKDAEESAWAQYQRMSGCPGHEWEPRNYKNGAGFCKHCNKFKSKVFTPEDLGCFCDVCGIPTYWSRQNKKFYCEEHAQDRDSIWWRQQRDDGEKGLNTTGSQLGDLFGYLEAKAREEND